MRLRGHLFLLVSRVTIGAFVASILGLVLTGDVGYIIVLSFAVPVAICGMVGVGTELSRARHASGRAVSAPRGRASRFIAAVGEGARNLVAPLPALPRSLARIRNRVVAIGPIVLAFVLTLLPGVEMIGWAVADAAAGRPWDGRDMRVGLHQQDAMNDLFAVIGGTRIYDVYFYDSYVIADAPTSPGAETADEYEWQGGHAFNTGPESIQPDGTDELFDASRIDFSMIADLVRKSEADTGWKDFTEFYPGIYSFGDDGPRISIHLATDYYDATYTYDLNGKLLTKSGSGIDDKPLEN